MTISAPNRNILWARTFVDELARCGLEAVCIAPGSRSTPLVFAFAENPHIKVYSHIDERCAAFFALGMAQSTRKPVAILCSSGTATANFHPAIIEARYANVPLIVLTADRQHELRDSGANQTVDQVKMFGDHVLWFYDVALPESNPPAVAIRNLRTLADRAYAKANGIEKGPVHLNFPFRKPLEPTPVETDVTDVEPYLNKDHRPTTVISSSILSPTTAQIEQLKAAILTSRRGLIVAGPRTPDGNTPAAIAALVHATGYPVFADSLSGLRFNDQIDTIGSYDTFLLNQPPFDAPDLILHVGAMPASAVLETWLNQIPTRQRILITPTGTWTDAYHRLTDLIQTDPALLCVAVSAQLNTVLSDSSWSGQVWQAEQIVQNTLNHELNQELFDGAVIANTVAALPSGRIFVASSLPVRHLEQYAAPRSQTIPVYSNRGASGIDGTISSAMGVAAAHPDEQILLITGDLAFYHDMNGMLAAKRCNINNLTILLLNNDGGGIFNRLPIANFDPPFTDLFLTPHGLDFEPAIRMYGLEYQCPDTLPDLRESIKRAVASGKSGVIEVRTDSKRDHVRRLEINQRVQEHLRTVFSTPSPAQP